MPTQSDRIFAALIFGISFFTAFIGPIIIWLLKREDSAFVDYYGKEYFNFLISYGIYTFIAFLSTIVLIGFLLLPIVGIVSFIFTIVAAVKALDGKIYRVPLTIPFFK
ncbi:DUF4870 domain-containing protein [Caldibacillus lycopersici]|uniref:DUF4870 domain-containing protein n=1 Tax=Perspicuibacillus lycopersici TaxID=1325689 RepID=A0AAE3ISX7_9BACI|nr:DUF4870 domain-containing protein [Perspicuibacillus lycopersici]MCU9613607.1 DUF4870 domain-containing protein [Perspicuibacillus lycopersici]